jgi:ketosteroid isomerase-like protein
MDPEQKIQAVYALYERWNKGELEGIIEAMDPDVEYVNPEYAVEPGTRRGHGGIHAAMLDNLNAAFASYEHEPHEVIPDGDDRILVLLTFRACGHSGAAIEVAEQHLWTLRDGKIVRIEWFHDEAAARTAAGLD